LVHPRHGGDVGRVARIALLNRWARVTARLALRLGAGEGDEATGVPPLFALSEAGLAQGPAVVRAQPHPDFRGAQTGYGIAIGVDLGHAQRVLLAWERLRREQAHDAVTVEIWAIVVTWQVACPLG